MDADAGVVQTAGPEHRADESELVALRTGAGPQRTAAPTHRNDMMEIMDDRHGQTSTLVMSQLPTDQWYASIGDNTLADAILDRLMHNAHRLELNGESMRKKLAKLTDGEHLSVKTHNTIR